jgi:histidine triad (HIT) family protein
MTKDCIFCKIVKGEVPSTQVYADDRAVAFRDINPAAPVHVLVIPREHVEFLASSKLSQEALLGHLMRVTAEVAKEMGVDRSGYRVLINQGRDAGQMVDHLHLHVLGGRQLGRMG